MRGNTVLWLAALASFAVLQAPGAKAAPLEAYGKLPFVGTIKVSPDGARRLTAWFNDTGNAPPPVEPDPGSETATATVNASALNLRTGPGTMYSVITSMPNGSTVTINQAPSQGWYNVTFNGKTGWCSGDYLDL